MNGYCYIVGAGDVFEKNINVSQNDYIICADAGFKYKNIFKKEPDLIVGDFDSLGGVPKQNNVLTAPCEKDETDMMLAFLKGYEKGYRRFIILGALGGKRADHSIANIQLLHYISCKGADAFIVDRERIFTCIKDKRISFSKHANGYISVFSLSDKTEVTIKNLKYELNKHTLYNSTPIGVSNEFKGSESYIEAKDGALLVSWEGKITDCTTE